MNHEKLTQSNIKNSDNVVTRVICLRSPPWDTEKGVIVCPMKERLGTLGVLEATSQRVHSRLKERERSV